MTEDERWDSWHIVEPDGSVSSAGAGFSPLLRRLPGGGSLAVLADRFPRGAERAYRIVAGNRSRLGPLVPGRLKRRADDLVSAREEQRAFELGSQSSKYQSSP